MSAERLVCAAAGDLKPAKVFAMMERYFEPLPHPKVEPLKPNPAKRAEAAATVATIPQKASIDYIAGIGTRITNEHPDYPALTLGLQVLGNRSGFTGRLMSIVREQEGLTYGVYALPVGFASLVDGYAMVWGTFAPQLFERGRAAVLREVRRIVKEGATDEEVVRHRTLFEARSRVSLGNSGALARAAHDIVADGRRLSELDQFPQRILKLTTKEVNAALKKYLNPDKLSEAAAGPIEKL
jgi:zinc protease